MTDMKHAYERALDRKKNDINAFVWKEQNGNEVRLMDMSQSQLQKVYDHCNQMLYNTVAWSPGKHVVRVNLQKAWDACNTELFLRYLLHECKVESLKTNKDVLDLINESKKRGLINENFITELFSGIPVVFEKITIGNLIDACIDKLGSFNKKLISNKFILSQGVWLTDDEKEDLIEYDENGKLRNRLDVMKERLFLNNIRLRIDQKGFSYKEFRALINLIPFPKISSLPTATLQLLRDKVLLLLDNELNYHIEKWEIIKLQIEKVAEYKKFELNENL